jgi:hypothetical protein
MSFSTPPLKSKQKYPQDVPQEARQSFTLKSKMRPKNYSQEMYVESLRNNTITLCNGPAGSGKTYFATKNNSSTPIVDLDAIIKVQGTNKFTILDELGKQVNAKLYGYSSFVIVDGLITTNSQLRDVIDSLTAHLNQYQPIFKLVYWNEDRASCLHNDKGRRHVSAETSINNLPYEKPNFQAFPEFSQKRIQSMKVVRKSPAITWISEILKSLEYDEWNITHITDSMKLKSDDWSLGGTWGDWRGESGTVEADTPLDFKKFDKVLEVICPSITFFAI